jgi:transcriptional regulator with XRE-family HTH domain
MTKAQLKKWRKEHKVSQQRLADLLGVAQNTIARWETGARKIPPFLQWALKGLEVEIRKGRR